MLFSGITFLYFFLPFMALYFIIPKSWRNGFLLAVSLIFYFFGEPIYVSLLIFSSVVDWLHGLYIEAHRGEKSAKYALISSIIINVTLLGVFKYADFFISTFNGILRTNIPLTNISLPIGISFFTFQTMSYTIDVYRGKARAQKNLTSFMTYVCLFPQLVAGPIVRYTDISAEVERRELRVSMVADGIRRFSVGLGKKVLIANLLGELCSNFNATDEKSLVFYWIYAISFTMQIYFDFSGYSDMAIGLGKVFGFNFPENFNYPFVSRSLSEFWRRWHITLGGWFRDYVYIPLGGNRVSVIKWVRNLAIVWLLTGFWHGARWNFVLWGAMFGVILVLEKLFIGKFLEKAPGFVGHIYTLFFVVMSFVIFNANEMREISENFKGMFGILDVPMCNSITLYNLRSYAVILVIAMMGACPFPKRLWDSYKGMSATILEPLGVALILITVTAFIINGSFNPFLYFRF